MSAPPSASPRLSACIITRNEADRIDACLSSLAFCDELVVVDSHSTDATREISARHGEIEALRAGGFADARGWSIPRLTEYFGRFLRHGNSWPDRQIRLYDRRAARWVGYEVHEKIAVDGAVGTLHAPLEHYAYRNLDDHLARLDRYAGLMAAQMHAAGRKAGLSQVLINPGWRFLRGMFIKLGVLDGWRGWLFHIVEAGYVRRKYLRLWALSRTPDLRRSD